MTTDYDKLRAADQMLKDLRQELSGKLQKPGANDRQLQDLHARVSKAIKALSGQG